LDLSDNFSDSKTPLSPISGTKTGWEIAKRWVKNQGSIFSLFLPIFWGKKSAFFMETNVMSHVWLKVAVI
jgi:hypothetical protein